MSFISLAIFSAVLYIIRYHLHNWLNDIILLQLDAWSKKEFIKAAFHRLTQFYELLDDAHTVSWERLD